MIYALLLFFFFLEYVRPTSYAPALLVLHLNSIVPLSAFAATLLTAGPATNERLIREPSTKMIYGLMGLVWISVLTADVQQFALDAQTILLGFVLIYWVIASQLDSIWKVKGVIGVLILVHLIVAALNPVLLTDPGNRHYITSGSFLGDGNDFALSLDVIAPFCLFLLQDSKGIMRKVFWGAALVIVIAGIVATQSRGGTLGLGAMALYYWFKSNRKFQTGAITVVAVMLILALAPGSYFGRIASIGDTQEGSAQGRITAWKAAMRMAWDNPLLGVGAAHFPTKIGTEYRPPDMIGSGMTAHSVYFLALGELGVPGFVLVVSLLVSNLRANKRLSKQAREQLGTKQSSELQLLASSSAAIIAFATAGAFLSALYYPHIYVLCGIVTAIRHVVRQSLQASPVETHPQLQPAAPSVHWALRPRRSVALERPTGGRL